ncbi:TPA: alpha-L-rhamnosidase, partial [bacterium]|nr:alpha-L-rhamnosidase [bacterium]
PKHPATSFAYDRTVGCMAWLESDEFRLITDETWFTDDTKAIEICKLGQEPFGDLDDAPEDFVRSGFGDLDVEPIIFNMLESDDVFFSQKDELLRISGVITNSISFDQIKHSDLIPIYHLRKQEDWKYLHKIQKETNMFGVPSILLDLIKERNARIKIKNLSSDKLQILWNGAESLFELDNYDGCMTELLEIAPDETKFSVPNGMRYVKIFVLGKPKRQFAIEITIESVGAKLEQIGSFWCDDEQLNRIYETAVHTNRICNQLALWDGIKRDRLPWVYDLYLSARGAYPLWNDFSIIKRSLMELGQTPEGEWMNSLPSYTLWWFVTIWEYILHTSDANFAEEIMPLIKKHAEWVEKNVDENGYLKVGGSFIDWVPMTQEESLLSLQAIYLIAKQALTNISQVMPDHALDIKWHIPEISEEKFLSSPALITKVLGILSGYISNEKTLDFLKDYEIADPLTPCSAYLLACVYADFNMPDKGLNVIRKLWGDMLDQGATTFWEAIRCEYPEDFHKHLTTFTAYNEYRMSLCHAWSSTPVEWFTRILLGVNPADLGFRKTEIAVWAPEGINKCEGTVPTPFGVIHVSWVRKDKDQIIVKTEIPKGIEVV